MVHWTVSLKSVISREKPSKNNANAMKKTGFSAYGVPLSTALGRVIETKALVPRGIKNKQLCCQ